MQNYVGRYMKLVIQETYTSLLQLKHFIEDDFNISTVTINKIIIKNLIRLIFVLEKWINVLGNLIHLKFIIEL